MLKIVDVIIFTIYYGYPDLDDVQQVYHNVELPDEE